MAVSGHDCNFGADLKPKVGLYFSGFSSLKMSDYLFLDVELGFIRKGTIENIYFQYDDEAPFKTYNNRLDYISLPIYLNLKIPLDDFTFYFFLGPRIDFLIGYNAESLNYFYKEFKSSILGYNCGMGFEINVNRNWMFILETGVCLDETPAYEDEVGNQIRNYSFQILFGLEKSSFAVDNR